jgi:hypothetical protein
MYRRRLTVWAALALAVAPVQALSAEKPALVVRIKSINGLLEDLKYFAQLGGGKESLDPIDNFLKSLIGEKGAETIDPNRPLGLYAILGTEFANSSWVGLIPVANEKAFLALLARNQLEAKAEGDDVYSVAGPMAGTPMYLRITNKYGYVTLQNKSNVAKEKLLDPAEVFASGPGTTFSAGLRLDALSDDLKKSLLAGMDLAKAEGISKEIATDLADSLINQSASLDMSFDVDRKAGAVVGELKLTGKTGSKLAANIRDLSQAKSVFAELASASAAGSLLVHFGVSQKLREAIGPAIDKAILGAIASSKDDTRREQTEKLLKALSETVKAGELDAALVLRGPDKDNHYTVVAGAKLVQGEAVAAAVLNVVQNLPEKEAARVKLNVEQAAGVQIHRLEDPSNLTEGTRQILGSSAIYFAIAGDRLVVAAGPDALTAVKKGLKGDPDVAPVMQFAVSMTRMAPLLAAFAKASGDSKAADYVAKTIQEELTNIDRDNDTILISVEGGNALRATAVVKAPVLKFLAKMTPRAAQ